MKTFIVTYYNAIKKVETKLYVSSSSLESAIAEEDKAIALINAFNPFISVKSVREVA